VAWLRSHWLTAVCPEPQLVLVSQMQIPSDEAQHLVFVHDD